MPAIEVGPPTDRPWRFVLIHPLWGGLQTSEFRMYNHAAVLSRQVEWRGQLRQALFVEHDDQRTRAWRMGWEDVTKPFQEGDVTWKQEHADAEATRALQESEAFKAQARRLEDHELAGQGLVALDDQETQIVRILTQQGPQAPAEVRRLLDLGEDRYLALVKSLVAKNLVRRVGAGSKMVLALVMPDEAAQPTAP